MISSQYNYWDGEEERGGLPPTLQFLDAEMVTRKMYPESFLDTKARRPCEHRPARTSSVLPLAAGLEERAPLHTSTFSPEAAGLQRDSVLGSQQSRRGHARAAAACPSHPTLAQGRGWAGSATGSTQPLFSYSNCRKTTNI